MFLKWLLEAFLLEFSQTSKKRRFFKIRAYSQQRFTYLTSTIETLEKRVEYAQR